MPQSNIKNQKSKIIANLRRSRITLFSIMLPLLAFTLAGATQSTLRLAYIILGFSLIIFLHELGHFVVARLCSVKCLAFSIGIGPRMCGWRKGARLNFGKDPFDPETLKEAAEKQSLEQGKTLGETEDEKNALKTADSAKPTSDQKLEHLEAATTHSDLPTSAKAPPHPANVGDTDYRVSWLPLGGYVRMLGQDDMDPTKISDDPRAFNRRPIWQRMCIVSAGVIMNLIFAAVAFSIIFSPGIGVEFPPAIVGNVQYGSPAWKADDGKGLHMGDQILNINGEQPRGFLEFTDLQMAAALSTGTEPLQLRVRPVGTHGEADKTVSILPVHSDQTGFLAIGVESLPGTKLVGSGKDYLDEKNNPDIKAAMDSTLYQADYVTNIDALQKIREGDKIVKVDDLDVHGDTDYTKMYDYVQSRNGHRVTLHLENTKNTSLAPIDITLVPHLERRPGVDASPTVLGLRPQLVLGDPTADSPAAAAGLKKGDHVIAIGVGVATREYPTAKDFLGTILNSDGNPIQIRYLRDGKEVTTTATPRKTKGDWKIGLPISEDLASTALSGPTPGSEADIAGVPSGAAITSLDGQAVSSWPDIYTLLRTKSPDAKINVEFSSAGKTIAAPLTFAKAESDALHTELQYQLGLHIENLIRNQHGANAGEAVMLGLDHTKKFILQVYMTLAGLFRGTVGAENLHGIVGITKVGYDVQERGPVWLWYVLAMVSVNLAVANFLPLPIVDGGLFLLLILEKIRGKPLSLKVQSAIQVVGIVLLAGLFLFVTYNDIGMFTK